MTTKRVVTEADFRKPEFVDAEAEDYEFRRDGVVVRKDRWEHGIRDICWRITGGCREFEIDNLLVVTEWLLEMIPDREETK